MRIIAGEHRGRRIEAPPGRGTRPMLDRVREALFSTLGELVDGARVLDLFAGTGSLSLEALSRGAASARAIESDPRVLAVLRGNAEALGVGAALEVARGDAVDPASWGAGRYQLVFLDPPYPWLADERRARVLDALRLLLAERLERGCLVLHAPRGALRSDELPEGARERCYGTTSLWYVEPDAEERA
jgi:16S rRNA (guanine966-N2)-methyltransferase